MPSGSAYEPQRKAAAIAALMAGAPPSVVAREHDIPVATIRSWRQKLRGENIITHYEKKAELGELVATYLEELLATLATQARFARDADWLRKQNAGDVAILHGVLVDKGVRILASLQPDDRDIAV